MFGFGKKTSVTLKVSGMHCAHCAKRVNDTLSGLKGVSKVRVDLGEGRVSFVADPAFSVDSAVSAVKALGFEVLS